ncbi:MAG: 50S ribosomal protein L35 [Candidatus Falkowbacteria bacterium]
MPKIKTHQATAKRFKVTGGSKVTQRKSGQAHNNAHESGSTTRSKRLDLSTTKTLTKTVKTLAQFN